MRIVSVNAGLPREFVWRDRRVKTAIFKRPVAGPVKVHRHNLEGDAQADRSVHGGPDKAVYAYSASHYASWRDELDGQELEWGSFGENLTLDDFDEHRIRVGDEFRAGTVRLVVTQPRLPCYKLDLRLGRDDMIQRMLENGRTGIYFGVLEEGELQQGDVLQRLRTRTEAVTAAEAVRLYTDRDVSVERLVRAIDTPHLSAGWRERFVRKLDRIEGRATSQVVR